MLGVEELDVVGISSSYVEYIDVDLMIVYLQNCYQTQTKELIDLMLDWGKHMQRHHQSCFLLSRTYSKDRSPSVIADVIVTTTFGV